MADAKTTVRPMLVTPADLAARYHKVLSNPLRHAIVMRTGARPCSPTELAEATGRPLKHVCRAIEILEQEEFVELVRKEKGPKGGWIYLYRAVSRFLVNAAEWAKLSEQQKAESTCRIVAELESDMDEALDAGTFWRDDHCLFRDHRRYDRQGMKRCDEIIERAHRELVEEEEASIERCIESGEETTLAVHALMNFPAAPQTPSHRR